MAFDLGSVVIRIQGDDARLNQSIRRTRSAIEAGLLPATRAVTQGFNQALNSIDQLANGLIVAGATMTATFGGILKSSLGFADLMDRGFVTMTALNGSLEEGRKSIQFLRDHALETNFTLRDTVTASTSLIPALDGGAAALKEWLPIVENIANLFSIDLPRAAAQMQRLLTAGPGATDLFRERGVLRFFGFDPNKEFGKDEVVEKLRARAKDIADATIVLTNTLGGQLSIVSDIISQMGETVLRGSGAFDDIKLALKSFNDALLSSKPRLEEFIKDNADAINKIISLAAVATASAAGLTVLGLSLRLATVAFRGLLLPIQLINSALTVTSTVLAAVGITGFIATLSSSIPVIGLVATLLVTGLVVAIDKVARAYAESNATGAQFLAQVFTLRDKLTEFGSGVIDQLIGIASELGGAPLNAIGKLVSNMAQMFGAATEDFDQFLEGIRSKVTGKGDIVSALVFEAFQGVPQAFANTLQGRKATEIVTKSMEQLIATGGKVIKEDLPSLFTEAINKAKAALESLLPGLSEELKLFSKEFREAWEAGLPSMEDSLKVFEDIQRAIEDTAVKTGELSQSQSLLQKFGIRTTAMIEEQIGQLLALGVIYRHDAFVVRQVTEAVKELREELEPVTEQIDLLAESGIILTRTLEGQEALIEHLVRTYQLTGHELEQLEEKLFRIRLSQGLVSQEVQIAREFRLRHTQTLEEEIDSMRRALPLLERFPVAYNALQQAIADLLPQWRTLEDQLRDVGVTTEESTRKQILSLQVLRNSVSDSSLAYQQLTARIKDYEAALRQGELSQRGFTGGVIEGLIQLRDQYNDTFQLGMDFVFRMEQALRTGLSDTLVSIANNDLESLKESFANLLRAIQREIADFLAQEAVKFFIKIFRGTSGDPADPTIDVVGLGLASASASVSPGSPTAGLPAPTAQSVPIEILNFITPEAVAIAMQERAPANAIVNVFSADAANNGPVRKTIRRGGV